MKELGAELMRLMETGVAAAGLFAPDVLLDFTPPQWRLQARGAGQVVESRRRLHPQPGTVPRYRIDATAHGFVIEWEERWQQDGQTMYCREMARADVVDGAITELSVYCTGDWDEQTQARHARDVRLLRP
ncbi:hypothetical protein JOE57_001568 [Microlunatus panaciterrae]|uniref:SnoaL-like domain-containing protein n=1 Tax=Microlunatus panaciterrae TaxID=400768 RepID=A0ABS2RI71_9ACTN|nr:hypothetical protein [Microlunatus panaciterrae]MBM7798647.1 hypothetical protein [Microlunatus panaciterrae]